MPWQLHAGIDRASRLVDQLLTLSRLDSLENLDDVETLPMADVLQSAVMDCYHPAQQAGIDVRLQVNARRPRIPGSSFCSACWCVICWTTPCVTARAAAW
jgi:signal transduction histidine kinase